MEDKWRIKKIGDNWMFIPKKERDEKSDYERLLNNISKREKKIESDLDKIKKLKEGLNEMKKKRTVEFNKMIKYHNKFLPNFSIFLDDDLYGNQQWGMWVSIGGKRKNIYLGTVSRVSYHLDLLENNIPHYNENNSYQDRVGYYSSLNPKNYEDDKDKGIIKSKIESYVCDVVQKNMLGVLKKDGNLDTFFDKKYKIKGTNILYDLYKYTSHYTPPQIERERKKGGRLGPLSVGKKKNG
jgi:hypothetical protein